MSIKAKCGHCQSSFSVRDEFAGKRVKCPQCAEPMTIPNKSSSPAQPARAGQSARPPAQGSGQPGTGLSPVLPHEAKPKSASKPVKPASPPSQAPLPAAAGTRTAAAAPMFIGAAGAAYDAKQKPRRPAANTTSNYYNPLLDLLDEAEVVARPRGTSCGNCGAEVQPNAIICVECGFNLETGEKLETAILIDDDDLIGSSRMSDAEKILAKAERDIADRPVTAVGQDFGDGNESFLISLVAGGAFLAFIGLGVGAVLGLDWFMDRFGLTPAMVSLAASITIYTLGFVWITIVAFTVHPAQGIACLFSGGTYCMIYGFMQGKGTVVPAIIMIAATLIGLATRFFSGSGEPDYSWVPAINGLLSSIVR
ncbi:MAG TPA: hypothetical protein PKD54_09670 [Pirellulaceae bacterium]|nr:hypothetical protein [Pirellulaceae bacterium]